MWQRMALLDVSGRSAALGPERVQCPSIGEFQGREVGVGVWGGGGHNTLVSRGRVDGIGGFQRGDLEINFHLKCK